MTTGATTASLQSFGSIERRIQDVESERDQCFRNGTILNTKFENGRWYVKMADDVTVGSDGTGQLTQPGHDPTNVSPNPNFQSDWLPWQTVSNDAVSFSIPPRVGQKVTLSAPYGRPEMGHILPYHTGPTNPLPSGVPDEVRLQIKHFDQAPTTNNPKPPDGSAPNSTFDQIINKDGHTTQVSSTTQDGQSQGPYTKTTHTNASKTLNTQKVTQTTEQSKIKEAATDTISRGTGTSDPDQVDAGDGSGGGNLPHELNRQMQGMRAAITQNQHHIAALHDVMSQLNTLAQTKIPALAVLDQFLLSKPENLLMAAEGILPKLGDYMGQAVTQAVAKLTNGFFSGVMSTATSTNTGSITAVLNQVVTLASNNGVDLSQTLPTAQAAVPAAAGGTSAPLLTALTAMTPGFNAAGVGVPFAGLLGQMTGVVSSGSSLLSGLSGMLDSQQNIVSGMTKSYRLGGY